MLARERAEALRRCLEKLEATVVELVRARLAGEDYVAICQKLNLKPARAHKMYHQAKGQLQSCVERELS
jgi:DNA-directed RNA polymerase specialized sigma24 family protein